MRQSHRYIMKSRLIFHATSTRLYMECCLLVATAQESENKNFIFYVDGVSFPHLETKWEKKDQKYSHTRLGRRFDAFVKLWIPKKFWDEKRPWNEKIVNEKLSHGNSGFVNISMKIPQGEFEMIDFHEILRLWKNSRKLVDQNLSKHDCNAHKFISKVSSQSC